ncbi:hypothetical protein GIB67_037004 [Kingdonia uniflora]|uniref:Uncharacterized protein n=1 Tax=Kingdonia uniflora TaxID=39325 RepID=A0A7J7LHG2_9MAGN|nr:hypothetical protein GIB67_037004 [Kingdonia uniflora]
MHGKPGDRVETYIDYLHLKKTNKSRMKAEDIMDLDNDLGDKDDDDVPYNQDKATYGDLECIIVTEVESFKQTGLQIDPD